MKTLPRYATATFATPVGPLSVAADSLGAVVGSAFGPAAKLRKRLKPCQLKTDPAGLPTVGRAIEAYFGDSRIPFPLALSPTGTPFQQRVWRALRAIPPGETRSYSQLASTLRSGARAVGRANATNPICLFIPCHRVIGADGSLAGYAFGETIKRRLLDHERQ